MLCLRPALSRYSHTYFLAFTSLPRVRAFQSELMFLLQLLRQSADCRLLAHSAYQAGAHSPQEVILAPMDKRWLEKNSSKLKGIKL